MGTESWYVAVPDKSDLLERCRRDSTFGEYLQWVSIFRAGGRGRLTASGSWILPRTSLEVEFCDEVKRINQAHPGIHQRIYTLDRYYDKIHYLLSWQRREGRWEVEDWSGYAIYGASCISKHLHATQGWPIRYSDAYQVLDVALMLEQITPEHLRLVYNPKDMEEKAVYKFWADRADEEEWNFICEYFEGLKSFYQEVANHGEAMIVIID